MQLRRLLSKAILVHVTKQYKIKLNKLKPGFLPGFFYLYPLYIQIYLKPVNIHAAIDEE